jgi:hypothetical protein
MFVDMLIYHTRIHLLANDPWLRRVSWSKHAKKITRMDAAAVAVMMGPNFDGPKFCRDVLFEAFI